MKIFIKLPLWLAVYCVYATAVLSPASAQATSTSDPAIVFKQGVKALQDGRSHIAEEKFRKVIELDPASAAAHTNLGVAYMHEKRWDDALAELRKAAKLAPNQPGITLNLGLTYYKKNDFKSAIEPFTTMLQLAPQSLQARYLLGLCYFFTDSYKQSVELLSPLWKQESNNLSYLYVLSIAADKASEPTLGKRALDQMLAIGRNTPEFHLYVGKAWLAKDNTDKALEEFEAAAAAEPKLPMVHYFLGRTHLERHEFPQAKTELLQDIAIEPDVPYNYEDLGVLYTFLDQPDTAKRYYLEAIRHDTTLVNSYVALAKIYRQQSQDKEALAMLDHAESLAPESASVHYLRARLLMHLGQTAKARQEFAASANLQKTMNDRIQQNFRADLAADAQGAAPQ